MTWQQLWVITGTAVTACPAGTYNPLNGSVGASACLTCATGSYSSVGASVCTACPAGSFCNYSPGSSTMVYIGCFVEPTGTQVMPNLLYQGNANTPQNCQQLAMAAGWKFFAVQGGGGDQCFAHTAYGGQTETARSTCNVPCTGDNTQTCGAAWVNQVYLNPNFASKNPAPQLCTPGMYSPQAATSCFNCPLGTFSSAPGSSACSNCSAGYSLFVEIALL